MKDRNAPQRVLDGTVIGRNMQRHRHQEFIRFPNRWGARSPRSSGTTVILREPDLGEDKLLVCFGSKPMRRLGGWPGRQSIAINQNMR
jgi:hypothetical protein